MNKKFTKLMAALALLTFLAIPMGMRGQAPVGTTLWGETWTGGDANETPSAYGFEGTTVYGGATLTYAQSSTNTKLYEEALAGGESPELLLSKSSQTWTISNIPTGQATGMALTFKSNKTTFDVTSTTTGITISGSQKSWTIASTSSVTTFNLTIKNTGSSNARIDDIVLSVTTAGGGDTPTTYTVTYNGNGNTSGEVPVDNTEYDEENNTVTVLGNTGDLAKTGHTFSGWCLNEGGTGTVYGPGSGQTATYAISANTTFYAKWTLNTHNITMPASDTYGSYSASATSNVPYGTTVTLTFAPAAGYESYIATWSVNGEAISGDTFTMPDEDVTVGVALNNYLKDELNYSFTGVSSGGYTNWSDRTGTSGAVYTGRTAGSSSQNYLQLNNSTSSSAGAYHSGIITTGSGGKVKKVIVTWAANGGTMPDARVLKVYGSNTAYSETADLYDLDTQGTLLGSIAKGTGTTLNIAGDYKYVGLLTDGAAYFTKIEIYWEPSTDPSITAEDMQIAYDATSGSIMGEIVNYVEGTVSATTDADWISNFTYDQADEIFEVDFAATVNPSAVARTANVTLTFTYGNNETTTKNVTVSQTGNPNAPGTQNNPYTVAQAIAATPSSGNVYIQGIVSSFYNTSIVGDGSNYRYYISDDGTTTTQLLVYKGTGLNQTTFTNVNDLLVGDEVVIYGTLITYQSAPEVASGNYLYSWNRPTYPIINANDVNLTYDATSGSIDYTISNPTSATLNATSTADWISNITVGAESVTFTTTANEGDADRSATITLSYEGATDKVITVTQAHYVPDYATLPFEFNGGKNAIEETNGLTQSGLGSDYADENTKLKFDSTDDYVILKINERPGILTFYIKGNSFSGGTFKVQTSADGVSYSDLATYTTFGSNSNETFEEIFDDLNENVRYIKWIYTNKSSGNVGLGNIKLEKVKAYTKDIVGNTWYFISSPTGSAPTNVDALSDLYYYDEQDHIWRNKEVTANASLFDFDYGKGYLCANADPTLQTTPEIVTLSFTGDLLTGNTYNVPVTYHATTSEGDDNTLAGWNLVGNPFNSNATLSADCYILNGSSINTQAQTAGYVIAPFAGVMVKASETGSVLFTKASENVVVPQLNQVQIEVGQKVLIRGGVSTCVHDNAIINFNEGSQLEKFMFNPDAAKLYIPQNGKEYAIVSSEANGEMPVSFKAIEDGEYTITVSPEGVDLNYLHLIDNMTGMDIDLLQTPSYTFDATTNDYESRFRLVFAGTSTNSATDESFAYYNGSEWQVNNEGEATLQVVDVMGRIVSTETVNGSFNLSLNQKAGVYMLRLINSNGVKTQKIMVR